MNKQKHFLVLFAFLAFGALTAQAQVKFGNNPTSIASTSLLELESDSLTFVLPRMSTTSRDAISGTPLEGSLIYNTSTNCVERFNGTSWACLVSSNVDLNIGDDDLDLAQDRELNLNGHMLTFLDATTGDIMVLDHSNGQINFSVYGNAVPEFYDSTFTYILGVNSQGDVVEFKESDIFAGGVDWSNITNIPADIADGDDDNQIVDEFALTSTTLSISLEDDGQAALTIDLGATFATDQQLADSMALDLDRDPTNEIQDVASADGSIIVTSSGIDFDLEVDETKLVGDGSITSTDITVTGGTNATLNDVTLALADNSVGNDEMADDAIGSDEIIDDSVTPADLEGSTAEYMMTTDASGNPQWESQAAVIAELEALTVLTYNSTDHELDYKDEDGVDHNLDLNVGSVSYDSATHALTYVAEDGTSTPLAFSEGSVAYNASTNVLTYTDETGDDTNIALNNSSIAQTANGDITHTSENSTSQTVVILSTDADNDIVSGSDNGNYLNVQDEETLTFYSDSTTSPLQHVIGSYTDEDTVETLIHETLTQVVNPNTVSSPLGLKTIATYIDEAGDDTDIKETITTMYDDNTASGSSLTKRVIATYTNEDDEEFEVSESVVELAYDGGDENLNFTDENDNDHNIAINIYGRDGHLTNSRYVDFDNNNLTFENNFGNPDKDLVVFKKTGELEFSQYTDTTTGAFYDPSPENHVLTVMEDGSVRHASIKDLETTTFYSDSTTAPKNKIGDYTNEDGDVQDVFENVSEVNNAQATGHKIADYTDETGATTDIMETVTSIDQDNGAATTKIIASYNDEDGGSTDILETVTDYSDLVSGTTHKIGEYTDENESATDVNETVTSVSGTAATGNAIGTYNDEAAGTTVINETVTAVANTVTGHKIADYTDEAGTTVDVNETVTAYADAAANNASKVKIGDYTDENGASVDVQENLTVLSLNADDTNLDYEDEAGTLTQLDFTNLVDNLETVTVYTDVTTAPKNKIGEYKDEDGNSVDVNENVSVLANVIAGHKIADYTDESGTAQDIDETITSISANNAATTMKVIGTYNDEAAGTTNIEETVTDYNDLVSGTKHKIGEYTDENESAVNVSETVTSISANNAATTMKVIGTYNDEAAGTTNIEETVTAYTDAVAAADAHKIGSYADENEASVDVNETITVYTDAAANNTSKVKIGDYKDEEGNSVDVKENLTVLSLDQVTTSPGYNRDLDYLDENGDLTSLDFTDLVDNLETVTQLQYDHNDEDLEYIDEDGNQFDIYVNIYGRNGDLIGDRIVDFDDHSLTFQNNYISTTNLVKFQKDGEIEFNQYTPTNFYDGNPANNVLQVLSTGEVRQGNITDLETTTTYTDLTTGPKNAIGNYINEDGADTTVYENVSVLTSSNTGQIIASYTDETGASTDIEETVTTSTSYNSGNKIADYVNEAGTTTDIEETITSITGAAATGNAIGTYNDENAGATVINETVTSVSGTAATGNAIGTYNDEAAGTTVINETVTTVTGAAATGNTIATYNNESAAAVDIKETVTVYTDAAATNASKVKIGAYSNESGASVDVQENLTILALNADDTNLDYTDEAGTTTQLDFTNLVDNVETVTVYTDMTTAPKNQIGSYKDEDGTTVAVNENVSVLDNVIAGHKIADYTDESGTSKDIDETITSITGAAATGNAIGTYNDENAGTTVINETVTSVSATIAGNKIAQYNDEAGTPTDIDETITAYTQAAAATASTRVIGSYQPETGAAQDVEESITSYTDVVAAADAHKIGSTNDEAGVSTDVNETVTVYTDAAATNVSKVKIGDYKNEDGSTVDVQENLTLISGTLVTGHLIGTYKDEAGGSTDIRESISTLTYDATSEEFVYTDENGNVNDFYANIYGTDGDLLGDREINLNSNHLTIEDATTGDVAVFEDNGSIDFSQYGSGTFTGTPTYNLSVDASGNVIETEAPIYGTNFTKFSGCYTTVGTVNTTYANFINGTTGSLPAGTYEVTVNYGWMGEKAATSTSGVAAGNFRTEFLIDGTKAHTDAFLQNEDPDPNDGQSQMSRSYYFTSGSAGTHTVLLKARLTAGTGEISDIDVVIKRVN